jgi:hypothetical protein
MEEIPICKWSVSYLHISNFSQFPTSPINIFVVLPEYSGRASLGLMYTPASRNETPISKLGQSLARPSHTEAQNSHVKYKAKGPAK